MVKQIYKNTNKEENTTIKLPKVLRDKLAELKFKYHIDELYQVIQLLYNVSDLTQLDSQLAREQIKTNKEVVGNQSDALTN